MIRIQQINDCLFTSSIFVLEEMFLTKSEYKKLSVSEAEAEEPKLSPVISPASLTRKDLVVNPDGSQVDVEDNTLLSVLDKAHILANMRNRFKRDCIYTFTASVLLSVNPWKQVPGMYSDQMQMLYTNKSLHSLPPHPYAIADTAYRYFQGDSKSQVLVVSGESGSGKTETAKVVINFLASHRERRQLHKQLAGQLLDDSVISDKGVHDRVISATPIMEAFGNASTIRNKNSSRFGKYHRLLYDRAGSLAGAEIKPLLLESSRVTGISSHERNFHIFYLMLAGMSDSELRTKYDIHKHEAFPLISNGLKRDEVRTKEDEEKFQELLHAFSVVGFSDQEREEIFCVIAGLLVLSQVQFQEQDEETKDEEGKRTKLVDVVNEEVLDKASILLGFDRAQLYKVLLNRTVKITNRTSAYSVPRGLAQVESTKATLIRTIYKRLFERIVERINELVAAASGGESPSKSAANKKIPDDLHIGVLDIFGFENLEKNSFEQLCINLTNEKLQQFFIRKVLEAEVKVYQAEGIHSANNDVSKLPLPDCSETLGCIKGALELLDDHCLRMTRNMPTDEEKYCSQVQRQFWNDRADSKLQPPKLPKAKREKDGGKVGIRAKTTEGFVIRHYAGEVLYTVTGWLEKNNERMSPEMECLVRDASHLEGQVVSGGQLVKSLSDAEACSYACEKFKSVRSKFMAELESVLAMLDKCAVHYIRCFNPNGSQRPGDFSTKYVEDQVVQCGTVELVNVMHHGFPNRQPLSQIAEKFQHLLPFDFRSLNHRDLTSVIMNAYEIPPSEYAIGFTTLFLKADQVRLLEQLRGVGELPSGRVLSVIRKQVMDRKFRRCMEVVKLVNWLPKLMKELKRKKLFSYGAGLAVTIAFILPRTRGWLTNAREKIRVRKEEEDRLRRDEEERLRKEEEVRLRIEEEERLKREEEERIRLEEEERLRAEEEEKRRLEEIALLATKERLRLEQEEQRLREEIRIQEQQAVEEEDDNPLALIAGPKIKKTGKVTPMTSTVPQLPRNHQAKENITQLNVPAPSWMTKTAANMAGNSLAKLPPVTAQMVNNVALFGITDLSALILYDGKRIMPVTTNENSVSETKSRSRRSSMGSVVPSLLPASIRASKFSAIAQHPFRHDVFATADAEEIGAVTIWRAGRGGVESRFRIQLAGVGNTANAASIVKVCFIAPDSTTFPSNVYSTDSHLLAVVVECCPEGSNVPAQYLVIVEAAISGSGGNRPSSATTVAGEEMFHVHKVEPIPPSQVMSNLNRKISFLKTSASGRIIAVGGKGLMMFFAVGKDADGVLRVDLLADQSFFPQIQTATFLSFISLFQVDPNLPIEPDDYQEEQLLVSTADGLLLRFPILVNAATCALDISGCGKIKECTVALAAKRLTSIVKKNDDAFYTITADGCIDHWVWVDRRPFRDVDASIALVAENSKAMFSHASILTREIVCFDAHAGKVVAFDPSDPDRLNPRLLYQFNSQGILGGF